jgi:hypothetical protein
MRNTYMVRIYLPSYYTVQAESEQAAEQKATARFKKAHKTWREPTVEVVMANGVLTGFWDVVDTAIDDYKERRL